MNSDTIVGWIATQLWNNWFMSLVLAIPIILTIHHHLHERATKRGATMSQALHGLRDEGAKKFVAQLEYKLKKVAQSGRSDYDFQFRRSDVWFENITFGFIFTVPIPTRYWDVIDSPGSREVAKKLLEEGGKDSEKGSGGLRVDWCISPKYPEDPFAPKWVLSCKWDRLDLRTNQFGGR